MEAYIRAGAPPAAADTLRCLMNRLQPSPVTQVYWRLLRDLTGLKHTRHYCINQPGSSSTS